MFYKSMLVCLIVLTLAGCKKENTESTAVDDNTMPPPCVFEEFKCDSKDYRTYMDALRQYHLDVFDCYYNAALKMLKTPERQALYLPVIHTYRDVMDNFDHHNVAVEMSFPGQLSIAYKVPSRENMLVLMDKYLRSMRIRVKPEQIPEQCRKLAPASARVDCYKKLLDEFIDKNIYEGYPPYREEFEEYRIGYHDMYYNYKPEFRNTVRAAEEAAWAFFNGTFDYPADAYEAMELYYLEMFDYFQNILSMYNS